MTRTQKDGGLPSSRSSGSRCVKRLGRSLHRSFEHHQASSESSTMSAENKTQGFSGGWWDKPLIAVDRPFEKARHRTPKLDTPMATASASSSLLPKKEFSSSAPSFGSIHACLPFPGFLDGRRERRSTPSFSSLKRSQWGSPMVAVRDRKALICSSSVSPPSSSSPRLPAALLFDCDGVLVDTEKDGHRISFNETFTEKELGVTWNVQLYGELLKIGGGKERMTAYFNKTGWPVKTPKTEEERKDFIASLHKRKTDLFMALIEKKLLPLRPGVERLIDEALAKGVKVAVCSTSNEKAVSAIVSFLLGPDRAEKITIFAGDVVPRKKPDPAIYLLAAETLGVDPSSCVVVEDSAIGLSAAKSAGMKCIITKSSYTAEEDFVTADAVFDCIGDPPEVRFDLNFCANLLQKQYVS